MKKVLTEAELFEKDQKKEKLMRHGLGIIDAQDGIIHVIGAKITCSDKLLENVAKDIEEWMDKMDHVPVYEITLKTDDGELYNIHFDKYIINFMWCRNCFEQWMIVKCRDRGYPKIHTRWLQHVQLAGDCYKFDKENNKISPNVFNLVSMDETLRNHSSALKPVPTREEMDSYLKGCGIGQVKEEQSGHIIDAMIHDPLNAELVKNNKEVIK